MWNPCYHTMMSKVHLATSEPGAASGSRSEGAQHTDEGFDPAVVTQRAHPDPPGCGEVVGSIVDEQDLMRVDVQLAQAVGIDLGAGLSMPIS